MDVSAISVSERDAAGATVRTVYAKNPPFYAVYGTDERVMVHYADQDPLTSEQRSALAVLNPLRGEINALIDGWRTSSQPAVAAKARRFDRRVADAIIAALEGDQAGAAALLEAIRNDVREERVSWARFAYLLVASGAVAVTALLIWFVTSGWFGAAIHKFPDDSGGLWLAAASGAVGAFFSIAIAIRNRTVLPDLRMRDNAADGVLRIVIGVIAAVLLVALVRTKVVVLAINGVNLGTDTAAMVAIIGFTAGFLERLVPDLLAKSSLASAPPPKPPLNAPPINRTAAPGKTPDGRGVGEQASEGGTPGASGPAQPSEEEDDDGGVDCCLCDDDKKVSEAEATPDAELPVTVGGVARAPVQ